ncbi:unnamed protein product, partial [Staurois parvus]
KPTTVKSICICSKACLLYSLWNIGVNPLHCVKTWFDPDFSDPPLHPVSPSYLLIRHMCGVPLHVLSLCVLLDFFFSWESAYDQHRANPYCTDRGQGFCILLEQNENSSYKL